MEAFQVVIKGFVADIIGSSTLGMMSMEMQADSNGLTEERIQLVKIPQHTMMKGRMSIETDMLGISKKVNDLIRQVFLQMLQKELTTQMFHLANHRYHVMVFHADSIYNHDFQGAKFYAKLNYYGVNYHVYVFETGAFHNYNHDKPKPWEWAYKGWIDPGSSGAILQFYLPKQA
jgi:hypothetical protein